MIGAYNAERIVSATAPNPDLRADDPFCGERISMTLEEYDRVRAQDDRFAVVPGHENLELERVVVRADAYVIVDKLDAYEHLVADDPRGKPSR